MYVETSYVPAKWIAMNIKENEIIEIIKNGESEKIEFKSKIPSSTALARLLSSFANSQGGFLLIGVGDNGQILGLTEQEITSGESLITKISNSIFEYNVPISKFIIEGKKILVVKIDKIQDENLPVISSSGDMFVRRESHTEAVSRQTTKAAISAIMSRNMSHNIGSHVFKKSSKELKIFVAMSFRDEEEPSLVDYFKAMERAMTNTNLPLRMLRMDKVEGDFEISQRIMDEIDQADIIIADFTLSSQNVCFELGYARAKSKRIIQSAKKGTKLEFDTRNWRTIFYRNATELESKLEPAIEVAYKEVLINVGT